MTLLNLGTLCIAWAVGTLITLPLYIDMHGGDAALAGRVLGVGGLATIAFVLLSSRLLARFTAPQLASAGAVVYGLGISILVAAQGNTATCYLAGATLGLGMGFNFTIIPMIYSALATDADRARQFSLLGAINGIGIGLAPAAASRALLFGASFQQIYIFAALLCCVGALLFAYVPIGDHARPAQRERSDWKSDLRAAAAVLRSETRYPILMVFMGSSMLGSLMGFQASIGASLGVDYGLFFVAYSTTVIAGRLLLGGAVARVDPHQAIVMLLVLVVAGLGGLLFVRHDNILYAACAIVVGFGYGLSYPLIQAQAVNVAPPGLRTQSLVVFTLFFIVGGQEFAVISGQLLTLAGHRAFLVTMVILAAIQLLIAVLHLRFASSPKRAMTLTARRPALPATDDHQ